MHEYSIVQALFDQIERNARAHAALSVRRVRVAIGQLAGVDVSLLRTAYDTFRVHTVCDAAPLEVNEIAAQWTCPAGHGDIPSARPLSCPVCGAPARLAAGDEIVLEQLELEVATCANRVDAATRM
jgi:hydrogenase nickel incorporation protein HypA/HybF